VPFVDAARAAAVDAWIGDMRSAPTVEEARALAKDELDFAHTLVDVAAWVADEESIETARTGLAEMEANVAAAQTPVQVAAVFDAAAGLHVPADAHVPSVIADLGADESDESLTKISLGSSTCYYSTGELIVVIVGFVFAIIPGVIFMILLC